MATVFGEIHYPATREYGNQRLVMDIERNIQNPAVNPLSRTGLVPPSARTAMDINFFIEIYGYAVFAVGMGHYGLVDMARGQVDFKIVL